MSNKKENVYCPVCSKTQDGIKDPTSAYLGERVRKEWFIGHCNDCMVDFYFPPNKDVPTKVVSDRQKRNVCKCLTCAGKLTY